MSALAQMNQRPYPDLEPREDGRGDVGPSYLVGQTLPGQEPAATVPQATRQVLAALRAVFVKVDVLRRFDWPLSCDGEAALHAYSTVVDARRRLLESLLEHGTICLADLVAAVEPIMDAYWLDKKNPRWTLLAVHEAVEQLRYEVAAAKYGSGEATSIPFHAWGPSLPVAA